MNPFRPGVIGRGVEKSGGRTKEFKRTVCNVPRRGESVSVSRPFNLSLRSSGSSHRTQCKGTTDVETASPVTRLLVNPCAPLPCLGRSIRTQNSRIFFMVKVNRRPRKRSEDPSLPFHRFSFRVPCPSPLATTPGEPRLPLLERVPSFRVFRFFVRRPLPP